MTAPIRIRVTDIVKLDQKNRARIPSLFMELTGIDENDYIVISHTAGQKGITIEPLRDGEVRNILTKNKSNI